MRLIGWVALLGLGLNSLAMAESHGGTNSSADHDAILVAIKEALVDEAQGVESKVVNTAWLDANGQLHESTMVHSSMRVRGIQVQAYLDEIKKPRVEIALDDKQGLLPECFAKDDHLARTIRVMPISYDGQFGTDLAPVVQQTGRMISDELSAYFKDSDLWHAKAFRQPLDSYTATISGIQPEPARYEAHITVGTAVAPKGHRVERVPGSDPVSTFFNGAPSSFPEDWLRVSMTVAKLATGEVVWSGSRNYRVPVRAVSYQPHELPQELMRTVSDTSSRWATELDSYASCEPIHFSVAQDSDQFVLDGGLTSGLTVGDRLLLMDQSRIPSRVLEPGTLAELSLVQVMSLDEDSAVIEMKAGAPINGVAGKVALPF